MRLPSVLPVLSLVSLLALASCGRPPETKTDVYARPSQSAASSQATPAAEQPAEEPLVARLPGPQAMADEVLKFELQQTERGFVSPQAPTCKPGGRNDPWVVQCGIVVVDPQDGERALVDIEIYDHDIDFGEQKKMLETLTAAMSTDGYRQVVPDIVEKLKDGRTIPLQMVCNQGSKPVGAAFCMSLPNPRMLVVTIVKPRAQEELGGRAMDDANYINRLVVAGIVHWAGAR